jgi:hypothetical protein
MANLTNKKVIRQIQAPGLDPHDIVAKYLSGTSGDYSLDEILDLVQGVVDTYVIKTSKSSESGYASVVNSAEATVSTTATILDTLVGKVGIQYKVGDIILMEETSNGTKVFDRWVSSTTLDSNGKVTNVTLAVLETQVATHHHEITLSHSRAKALTGISSSPTVSLTSVGSAVSVVTSVAGTFLTSVTLSGGGDTLVLSSSSASGSVASHSHTVDSHSHTFKPSSLVSQTLPVYTSLTSTKHKPHTHTVVSAAGKSTNGTAFSVATGVKSSATFIQSLKDSSNQTTGSTSLTTKDNTDGLTTTTQSSTTTSSSGAHTHDVEVKSTTKVITSVKYSAPSVQSNVMTSVSYAAVSVVTSYKDAPTASVVTSFVASVDASGILSFTTSSGNAVTSATTITGYASINRVTGVSQKTQSAGSLTVTSAQITSTGTAQSAGAHTHVFEHTHGIPAHKHSIDNHTHTYVKTVASATAIAITDLNTSSYTPHTHANNVGVASTSTDGTEINIVTGGSTTSVVQNLKTSTFTTDSTSPVTDTKYVALVGEITFPGLTPSYASVSVSTKSITPAVAGTEKALKSITFTSASFVTTTTSGTIKTGKNIGGE